MDERVYSIALGGLIHDIGKFLQRAEIEKDFPEVEKNYGGFCPLTRKNIFSHLHGAYSALFIEKFIPDGLFEKEILYNAARHHNNPMDDIYKKADIISAGMDRYDEETDGENYKEARLLSIFDMIELNFSILDENENINPQWVYKLHPLSENQIDLIYPFYLKNKDRISFETKKAVGEYKDLWNQFKKEVESLNSIDDARFYFNELYWLIEKYTWCIPSATNVLPDISLFDHLKTTSAIATCLYYIEQLNIKNEKEFCIYAGDISGIQNYIFRISQAQGVGGIAKRLRGRSFFVSMLTEILARYITEQLGYTKTNIIFCGGGNFEILLATTEFTNSFLNDLEEKVNTWLIKNYHGELGFIGARLEISGEELKTNYNYSKKRIQEKIEINKQRKFKIFINNPQFWFETSEANSRVHICVSCNLERVKDSGEICSICELDKKVGSVLPESKYINFRFQKNNIPPEHILVSIDFKEFGIVDLIGDIKEAYFANLIKNSNSIYCTSMDGFVKAKYPIAKSIPYATEKIENLVTEKDEEESSIVYPNQTLSFTTLADISEGDKRIGILKMDVDYLGLIFTNGFPETLKKEIISVSRIATLSRLLSNFFSFIVDQTCKEIFESWKTHTAWNHKNSISNCFYLLFSGGDDLLIIGPWDQIIELARKIRRKFKHFTCENPNITISGGIYICKPKYPISLAVKKSDEALHQSKIKGKNRITVMGETFVWDHEDECSRVFNEGMKMKYVSFENIEIKEEKIFLKGRSQENIIKTLTFEELADFANYLLKAYNNKKISRRFIHRLLEAKEIFFQKEYNDITGRDEEEHNYMFIPYLLYNIERNVRVDEKLNFKRMLISEGNAEKYVRQAKFPCKYTLMKTRN